MPILMPSIIIPEHALLVILMAALNVRTKGVKHVTSLKIISSIPTDAHFVGLKIVQSVNLWLFVRDVAQDTDLMHVEMFVSRTEAEDVDYHSWSGKSLMEKGTIISLQLKSKTSDSTNKILIILKLL